MKTKIILPLAALAVFASLLTVGVGPSRAAGTLLVDDDNAQCPSATFTTIQAAVTAAAPGDTVQVCAGAYAGNVSINKALTLSGAQAGNPVAGRTFGGAGESTSTGQITIQAAGVTVDGFSLTNPGQTLGILIKTAGDSAIIRNNIINTVGGAALAGDVQAVYLEHGPDNVRVIGNEITNVQSGTRSSKGVYVGDSSAANPSLNTRVEGNSISDILSGSRGAYGIQVNNGASTNPAAVGYTEVVISDNVIDNVRGGISPAPSPDHLRGWAHAIGLEGDTPNVVVTGNSISNVVDANPNPAAPIPNDAIAVLFEANPSLSTGHVNNNDFDGVEIGIAIHPTNSGAPAGATVDGACNWWGSASGPGPVGPGTGAKVSPNVTYTPWLTAPGGQCVGPDADGDGVTDGADNCPNAQNTDQADADGDNVGDVCDPDADGDGIADTCDVDFTAGPDLDNDGIVDGVGCDTQIGPPTSKEQCKNGGWQNYNSPRTFKNQGDCVQFVNTTK